MPISRKLDSLLKDIQDDYFAIREEFVKAGAEVVVNGIGSGLASPVDTAAYVESHSIRTTGGTGRGRTSRNRPTHPNPGAAKSASLNTLLSEAESLPRIEVPVYFNNNSPHAQVVEHGNSSWKTHPNGYKIYTTLKREARNILTQAVNKVKAKR